MHRSCNRNALLAKCCFLPVLPSAITGRSCRVHAWRRSSGAGGVSHSSTSIQTSVGCVDRVLLPLNPSLGTLRAPWIQFHGSLPSEYARVAVPTRCVKHCASSITALVASSECHPCGLTTKRKICCLCVHTPSPAWSFHEVGATVSCSSASMQLFSMLPTHLFPAVVLIFFCWLHMYFWCVGNMQKMHLSRSR